MKISNNKILITVGASGIGLGLTENNEHKDLFNRVLEKHCGLRNSAPTVGDFIEAALIC